MTTTQKSQEDDPLIAAELERALAPYKKLVPPKMLEIYRGILRDALTQHPVGKALVDRVRDLERRPRPMSGEKTKEGVVVAESAKSAEAADKEPSITKK